MPQCPTGTFLYTIRPGDSLWLIAQQYHTTIDAIATMNLGIDINNLYVNQTICVPTEIKDYTSYPNPAPMGKSTAETDLNNYLRMLWEQHVFWTRLVILGMVYDLPDTELVTNRLLQNPKDFEALLRPLYGDAASDFSDLFTSHLVIASELVKAAKADDDAAAADAEKRWYANADEIAAFLASINPYWSQDDWKSMLHEHLALTKEEAVDMLTENYSDGISTFDEIERQALEMADEMTNGIVNQFPDLFMN